MEYAKYIRKEIGIGVIKIYGLYEHWYYTRTGQWTAEYVMTVDHDI